ncbi:PPE family protein, partial [Mycobacterium tuberculosis]
GYAGSSSVATQVTPFAAPPPTTNAAGLATQGVAVAQAVGASAGNARSLVSEVLEFLATAGTNYNKTVASLMNAVTGVPYASSVYNSMLGLGFAESKMVLPANDTVISTIFGMVQFQKFFNPVTPFNPDLIPKSALGAGLGLRSAISSGLGSTAPAISAGASQAGSVGGMSVPPSWAAATPAIRTVAAVFSSTGLQAVPAAAISEGSLLSQMALASVAGGALGGAAARATGGFLGGGRVTAVKKSLKDSDSPDKLRRVVAHMMEKPESVQHWHTDEDGLDDLLAELKKKPGIHAVHMAGGNKAEIAPTISESG